MDLFPRWKVSHSLLEYVALFGPKYRIPCSSVSDSLLQRIIFLGGTYQIPCCNVLDTLVGCIAFLVGMPTVPCRITPLPLRGRAPILCDLAVLALHRLSFTHAVRSSVSGDCCWKSRAPTTGVHFARLSRPLHMSPLERNGRICSLGTIAVRLEICGSRALACLRRRLTRCPPAL